jgi:predicted transcriptional regulator
MDSLTQKQTSRTKKLVTFEASEAWVRWVDGLADAVGASRSTTIDQALRRLADSVGYEASPPKR